MVAKVQTSKPLSIAKSSNTKGSEHVEWETHLKRFLKLR